MIKPENGSAKILLYFFRTSRAFACQGLIYFISLCLVPALCAAGPTQTPMDVIFDLDWTLIAPTTTESQKQSGERLIEVEGEIYRLNPHALPVLDYLLRSSDFRVSLFSGGTAVRNQGVAKVLLSEIQKHNPMATFHRVLHKEDLAVHSSDENLPFSERYKKDLAKAGFILDRAVLVDDIKNFTPESQSKNLLWLGSTFKDQPVFMESNSGKPYFPRTEIEWQREQLKLVIALDRILRRDLGHHSDPITENYSWSQLNETLGILKSPEQFRLAPLCRLVF